MIIIIASLMALASCSWLGSSKEKKCRQARDKILQLSLAHEKKLEQLAPQKERRPADEIRRFQEALLGPAETFVPRCVETLPEKSIDCINRSTKLMDLGPCVE